MKARVPQENLEVGIGDGKTTEASSITHDTTNKRFVYKVSNFDADVVGEMKLKVTVEFENVSGLAGEKFKFQVSAGDLSVNGATLAGMVIEHNVPGNDDKLLAADKTGVARSDFLEVQDEKIEISLKGLSNETYVAGSSNKKVMCFTLKANNSGDVKVDEITVEDGAGNTAELVNHFSTWQLLDDKGKVLEEVGNFTAGGGGVTDGSLKFEDLEEKIVIPRNQIREFCISVVTIDQQASGATPLILKVASILAYDNDDRTVSITGTPLTGGTIAFAGTGQLSIDFDNTANEAKSRIITAASDTSPHHILGVWTLSAVNDDVYVDKWRFENDLDDTASTTSAEEFKATSSVIEVQLRDMATNQVIATASAKFKQSTDFDTAGKPVFQNPTYRMVVDFDEINKALLVPRNGTKRVAITAALDNINKSTKTNTQLRIQPIAETHDTNGDASKGIIARSKSSSSTLGAADITLNLGDNDNGPLTDHVGFTTDAIADDKNAGNLFVTRRAVPEFTLDKTQHNVSLGVSRTEVARFKVKAIADKVSLGRFTGRVGTTNVNFSNTAGDYELFQDNTCGDSMIDDNKEVPITVKVLSASNNEHESTSNDKYVFVDFTDPQLLSAAGEEKCYALTTKITDTAPTTGTPVRNGSFRLVTDAATTNPDKATDLRVLNNPDVALFDTAAFGPVTNEGSFFIYSDIASLTPPAFTDGDTTATSQWFNGFKLTVPSQQVTYAISQ